MSYYYNKSIYNEVRSTAGFNLRKSEVRTMEYFSNYTQFV